MKPDNLTLALLLCLASCSPHAAETRATSGPHRTALLELYTSEGCSSCPPADQWLADLPQHLNTAQVIPLALHVDYWDYIGWQDRFANPAYTQRQRDHAQRGRLNTIYTPQFVLNGNDLRPLTTLTRKLAAINAEAATTRLTLAASLTQNLTIDWQVEGMQPGDTLRLAIVENGLSSEVARGENQGRQLHHDHVLRQLLRESAASGTRTVTLNPNWQREQLALIGFVESRNGDIRQALKLGLQP